MDLHFKKILQSAVEKMGERGQSGSRESREEAAEVLCAHGDGSLGWGQGVLGVQRTRWIGGPFGRTDRSCGWMGLGRGHEESGAELTAVRQNN